MLVFTAAMAGSPETNQEAAKKLAFVERDIRFMLIIYYYSPFVGQPYTLFFRVKFYAVDPLALHRNSK